jgi:hypothetical protein
MLAAALLAAATIAITAPPLLAATAAASRNQTVGIISEGGDPDSIRIVTELASALDDNTFHVLPVVGRGPVQTVSDLSRLEGADAGIVPSDVLPYLRREGRLQGADPPLRYIGKLYQEELHVLARRDIAGVADLAGKRVSFDVRDSDTSITASLVFAALNVNVQPVFLDGASALGMLRRGEIAALALVARKPARLFYDLNRGDGLHFLPVPVTSAVSAIYPPARLGIEDYPLLIGAGEAGRGAPIGTVAVPKVLAVRNWPPGSARHRDLSRLVEELFLGVPALRAPGRDPAWQGLDLAADVRGWDRFAPAQARLSGESAMPAEPPTSGASTAPATPRRSTVPKNKDHEALFQEFLRWRQGREASGRAAPAGSDAMFQEFLRWQEGRR